MHQHKKGQHGFILIYLRSIAKQVIPTSINHSRPLIPDGIHLIFKRGLRGEISQTYPYMLSAKQGCISCHFYNVFGMTRLGIEPTASRSRSERSTPKPPLRTAWFHGQTKLSATSSHGSMCRLVRSDFIHLNVKIQINVLYKNTEYITLS